MEDVTVAQVPGGIYVLNSTVQKVEQSTLTSRLEGYPRQYRFTLAAPSNTIERVILDQKGNRVDADLWFHSTKISQ